MEANKFPKRLDTPITKEAYRGYVTSTANALQRTAWAISRAVKAIPERSTRARMPLYRD